MEKCEIDKITYGDGLYLNIRQMYHEILVLGKICFEDDVFDNLVISIVSKLTSNMQNLNPILQFFTGPFAPTLFTHIRSTLQLSPADVAKYVVKQKPSDVSAPPEDLDLD